MHTPKRGRTVARLTCEALEDRLNPVPAYALTNTGLIAFDTLSPGVTTTVAFPGVPSSEAFVGLDFRPQNGYLYALAVNLTSGNGTLYALSVRTGRLQSVGVSGGVDLAADLPSPLAAGYGFDFDPTTDRIRVVTSTGLNFQIDPNTGTDLPPDGALNGDATAGDATAYTNNQINATNTTLYTLNAAADTLYRQDPTTGLLTAVGTVAVGGVTVNFTNVDGFDIPAGVNAPAPSGTPVVAGGGFALLNVGGVSQLYSINLTSGAAVLMGIVGSGAPVRGLAVQSGLGYPVIGITGVGAGTMLTRANLADIAGTAVTAGVVGLVPLETIVGADYRPQTGQLYALGVPPAGGDGTLYRIDPQTRTATAVGGPLGVDLSVDLPAPGPANYGFDFDPTLNQIRVVTSTGLNFRIDPGSGGPIGGIGAAPDSNIPASTVSAAAYTNSFGQSTTVGNPTTLYTLDATTNTLFIQSPPNTGAQTQGKPVTLGGAPLDFTAVNGFDIPPGVRVSSSGSVATGFGFAALTVGGTPGVYVINLATGAAGPVGPAGAPVSGMALGDASGGTVAFQSAAATLTEGDGLNVVLTRLGGTGPQTVTVTVTGGTATAGTDFTSGGPYVVSFAQGQSTASLNLAFPRDGVAEGTETLVLTITAVDSGAPGAQNTMTVTINDTPQQFGRAFGTADVIPAVGTIPGAGGGIAVTYPYGATVLGGVRVAIGDVTGDGFDDLVTVPSAGFALVKVFSGANGAEVASFFAYPPVLNLPASLAVGDVNNDGFDDIVVGTASGFGAILVFSGKDFSQLGQLFPFGALPVGVNVAVGDVDGDGQQDIIAGTASGVGVVGVYSGQTFAQKQLFLPFGGFASGVTVAAGDLNGDGTDELVVGTASVIPAVGVFSGPTLQTLFLPFGGFPGGANVAVGDANGDHLLDITAGLTTGFAFSGSFDGRSLALLGYLLPFGAFPGGVFVG